MNEKSFRFWFSVVVISVSLGGVLSSFLASFYRGIYEIKNPSKSRKRFPPYLTGMFERVYFSVAVAAGGATTINSVMAWLAAKQINVFNYRDPYPEGPTLNNAREWHFAALIFSFINSFYGVVGGLCYRHWNTAIEILPFFESISSIYKDRNPSIAILGLFIIAAGIVVGIEMHLDKMIKYYKNHGYKCICNNIATSTKQIYNEYIDRRHKYI